MRTQILTVSLGCVVGAAAAGPALAVERDGFGLSVLVGSEARQEYVGRGTTYIEALRGREYTLSITNPLGRRVAVALSVDGLNTIDAKHTSARDARKWVLGPFETVEISGWQVNQNDARRFFFTGERHSYGTYLGETQNLGVIEAAFFRERVCERRPWIDVQRREGGHDQMRDKAEAKPAAPSSASAGARGAMEAERSSTSDELAATGIGHRDEHQVQAVQLDLESTPAAVLQLRYEYRPALVRLGLLPTRTSPTALDRRERASGFSRSYCPDPPAREW